MSRGERESSAEPEGVLPGRRKKKKKKRKKEMKKGIKGTIPKIVCPFMSHTQKVRCVGLKNVKTVFKIK